MTQVELFRFLERTAWDHVYWECIERRAKELKSDGCTGTGEWFRASCLEHDIHTRTHKTFFDDPITFQQAAYAIRRRVQQASVLGVFSPVSWVRWLGVEIGGRIAWKEGPMKYKNLIVLFAVTLLFSGCALVKTTRCSDITTWGISMNEPITGIFINMGYVHWQRVAAPEDYKGAVDCSNFKESAPPSSAVAGAPSP